MKNTGRDFLVGSIFFGGMVLVGIFSVVIKDLPTLQGQQGYLAVIFDQVSGLERGHKVLASGMEVGQVKDLNLLDDGRVQVNITLTKTLKLYKGYDISVRDASALGGKYINISIGKYQEGALEQNPIGHNEASTIPLPGTAQPSLLDDPNLRDAIASIKRIATKIDEGEGTLGLLINQRDIYDNIAKAADNIKEVTEQLKGTETTLGKLINDNTLFARLDNIVKNIEKISHDLRFGKGTLGKLLAKDEVYNDLKQAIKHADQTLDNLANITNDVKAGKGTVGKLFVEETVYNELEKALVDARTMMNNINEVAQQISQGKGTLGALIQDEAMANNVKNTLANIDIVVAKLKNGEGTIGKLIVEDELYKEAQRLVKSLSESLEDTREQAPISAFTGLLFKAF